MQVGTQWNYYKNVFGGADGVIYAIGPDGKLFWYKHEGHLDGSSSWANGAQPMQVGTQWNYYKNVFGGADGVIYAIEPST